MNHTQILISLTSAIIGGIIATFLKTYLEEKKDLETRRSEIISNDYRSLLVFMACALNIKNKKHFTVNEQVEGRNAEDYLNQLR